MKENLAKAIEIIGGQTATACALSVSQSRVWQWLHECKRGVPAEYCLPIERLTNGAVTAEQLRPDVFLPPEERPHE